MQYSVTQVFYCRKCSDRLSVGVRVNENQPEAIFWHTSDDNDTHTPEPVFHRPMGDSRFKANG